ncbi:hypothetical protein M408DRAFT_329928 [Serendipita vermifera MAFF 305830]|uniref:Ankyrin n=1 Tax=Serendipita vermifera MAFF 305830 TaxID=933852 RepID=A0A0C3B5J2_SERVB|nr:hypothetical protein M408DRAFT_329928 [Serendipita vermifera MAFF 305830]
MLLHEAIANANLRAASDAIAERPDDVNLLDDCHRSVLFCAIVGHDLRTPVPSSAERNAILKAILSRAELSIYALNAAMDCARGATPLTLACRLGRVEQVMTLLDCPSVLVNTRDASGLTPLMHAVRVENPRIVVALLRSGAKIDSLDPIQRSVFEYSKNPEIRIHLENQLRLDRNPGSTSSRSTTSSPSAQLNACSPPWPQPPSSTPSGLIGNVTPEALFRLLIRAVNSQDLSLLNACVQIIVSGASRPPSPISHPPPLRAVAHYSVINNLDEAGFAPIHHAMMSRSPNFAIIDALYAAGADMNLLTSSLKTPLEILVDYYAVSSTSPEENYSLYLLVRHLIQDLQVSILHRDDQMETCLHRAAEHGSCRELLEALVESDVGGTARALKNKRSLKPVDVAKPQYRSVFGERPDSMCTLRPLHTKRSLGSVSSFSSFTSVSSMASTPTITPASSPSQKDTQLVGMSLQEALRGSQILLDEIDLSLLQRTLFYRSSLDMDRAAPEIDQSLSQTSSEVIAYWRSCLSLIREELDSSQKAIVKSHLLVARTRRDVDKRTRDEERELAEAMMVWEEQQIIGERFALKEQARGRAFTAPARMAESPSDSEASQKFWMLPRKKWSISGTSTPTEATGVFPSSSETTTSRSSRVTSYIKHKLRPLSRPPQSRNKTPSSAGRRGEPLKIRTTDLNPPEDPGLEDDSVETEIGHQLNDLSIIDGGSSSPSSSTARIGRSVSTRGTIRKAPVVLTRLHTDLLRMEEYARGIHVLALDFQNETAKAEQMIHHCLLRCAQAGEGQEYEDEKELERLRTILLVGLESKVDEMCEALEVVRKWNGLVRSLLREFRKKIKGGTPVELLNIHP